MTQASEQQEQLAAYDEYEGVTWICPRCAYPLEMIADHHCTELWECPQCGYVRRIEQ